MISYILFIIIVKREKDISRNENIIDKFIPMQYNYNIAVYGKNQRK